MRRLSIILLLIVAISISAAPVWVTMSGWIFPWDNYHVEMRGSDDGWFCGYYGTIAKYTGGYDSTGSSWGLSSAPGTYAIYGISAIDDNSAWAVGAGGKILHYNSATFQWQEVTSPTTYDLHDVLMISATDGWAVGDHVILHYNGSTWSIYTQAGTNLNYLWRSSWASASNNLWIGGDQGKLARYNGSSFTVYTGPISTAIIYGLWFNDNFNSGWASDDNGHILHWQGVSWQFVSQPVNGKLYGMCFSSPTKGWCVGENGVILQYTNFAWQRYLPDAGNALFSVSMMNDNQGWIVGGNGTILKLGNDVKVEQTTLGTLKGMYR